MVAGVAEDVEGSLHAHRAGSREAEVEDLHRDSTFTPTAVDVDGRSEEEGVPFTDLGGDGGHGKTAVHNGE